MLFQKIISENTILDISNFDDSGKILDKDSITTQKAFQDIHDRLDTVSQVFDGLMTSTDKIRLDRQVVDHNTYSITGIIKLPLFSTSEDLTSTQSTGDFIINGFLTNIPELNHTFTASKDTYIDVDHNNQITYVEVNNGDTEPSLTNNKLRLSKVITDADKVTNTDSYSPIIADNFVKLGQEIEITDNSLILNKKIVDKITSTTNTIDFKAKQLVIDASTDNMESINRENGQRGFIKLLNSQNIPSWSSEFIFPYHTPKLTGTVVFDYIIVDDKIMMFLLTQDPKQSEVIITTDMVLDTNSCTTYRVNTTDNEVTITTDISCNNFIVVDESNKFSINKCIIDAGTASETIHGESTVELTNDGMYVEFIKIGTDWKIKG